MEKGHVFLFHDQTCPCCFTLIYKEGSDGSDDNGT